MDEPSESQSLPNRRGTRVAEALESQRHLGGGAVRIAEAPVWQSRWRWPGDASRLQDKIREENRVPPMLTGYAA
jgi:hypothetical protein